MDKAGLLRITGRFLLLLAGCMLIPLAFSLNAGEDFLHFLYAVAASSVAGGLLSIFGRGRRTELAQRDGILLVVTVWFAVCLFGSLPFFLSPHYQGFTDAFFEAASGFTTTGATILADVESLPRSLQLWRCLSSWVGGMGVILLGIAVLPLISIGGMPLYQADFPGASSEKLALRTRETAKALWRIYSALTLFLFLALRLAGMEWFDALCHAFSTVSTGGFSTRNNGIAAFESPAIEAILVIFMLLAGINFTLHYRFWVKRQFRRFFSNPETRFYILVAAASALAVFLSLILHDGFSVGPATRHSLFQVSSVMTGTGFASDNFANWNSFSQMILLVLMFFGGCTGSTTGGLKASRVLLLLKVIGREFRRLVEQRGVFVVRLGTRTIQESTLQSLLNLVYLAFLTNLISCLLLSLAGVDVFTCISAVAACMFNVGPGLGHFGPSHNYGELNSFAKWVLSFCMLVGRLEFYSILVLCTRAFWRR